MKTINPEGFLQMNKIIEHKSISEEIDGEGQITKACDTKMIYEDLKCAEERRLGFDRRCYVYTDHIPERRSDRERRKSTRNTTRVKS